MTTYRVRDGSRLVTFEGELLASSSSHRDDSPRWTELALYKIDDSDKYLLSKVGRSLVVHVPGCSRIMGKLNRFIEEHPEREPDDGFSYDDCVPDVYDLNTLLIEQTRYTVVIAETAEDIVRSLNVRKGGVEYLPRMAVTLLEQASANDQTMADAFMVRHVS